VTAIHPRRVNHINFVPSDYDAALAHLTGFYGARFLMDVPVALPDRACLLDLGGMYVELFTPGFAGQLKTFDAHGACNLGVEFQADLGEVRAATAERGFRGDLDFGSVVHIHGDNVHGIALEFFEKPFIGPGRIEAVPPVAEPGYWRDDHALGLMGLKGLTVAVADAAAAAADLESLLAGERRYAEARPGIGAEAVGVAVADTIVEFLAPVADGPVRAHLERFGPGVMSDIFRVRDLDAVRRYHAERGVETIAGTAADRVAAPPASNQGILFEFVQ
jgi:hypothetical protein